jgi:hypothetical protein
MAFRAFKGARPQQILGYHDYLMVTAGKKIHSGTAWAVSQAARSSSLREPSARWRKVR